jgi:hypothetical protein
VSDPEKHVVMTHHIQRLIRNGLELAELVDRHESRRTIVIPLHYRMRGHLEGPVSVTYVLEKAAADLRHAAAELDAERLNVLGWVQQ